MLAKVDNSLPRFISLLGWADLGLKSHDHLRCNRLEQSVPVFWLTQLQVSIHKLAEVTVSSRGEATILARLLRSRANKTSY